MLALLESRIRRFDEAGLTGDQVLHAITGLVPAGAQARILGACNIKGTGLDFVYRWVSIDRTQRRLAALVEAEASAVPPILRALAGHEEYGVVDASLVANQLTELLDAERFPTPALRKEAEAVLRRVEQVAAEREQARAEGGASRAPLRQLVRDAGDLADGIRRRRVADQLYADLADRRVGQARAARVARALVDRDKDH